MRVRGTSRGREGAHHNGDSVAVREEAQRGVGANEARPTLQADRGRGVGNGGKARGEGSPRMRSKSVQTMKIPPRRELRSSNALSLRDSSLACARSGGAANENKLQKILIVQTTSCQHSTVLAPQRLNSRQTGRDLESAGWTASIGASQNMRAFAAAASMAKSESNGSIGGRGVHLQ